MSQLDLALVATGLLVVSLGLLSRPLKNTFLSPPLIAMVFGIMLGPVVLDWLDPDRWGPPDRILEHAARITLAIGLMGVALRLPRAFMWHHARTLVVLLAVIMPLTALAGGLLAHWLLDVPLLLGLLIGAVISPTDPIVSTAIVTGQVAEKNLPPRLRHIISAEAGSNDGLALPLVLLPILLLSRPSDDPWSHWLCDIVLWKNGGALVFGGLLGVAMGRLLRWAESRHYIEAPSFLAYTVAVSLLSLGAAELLGTNGILAVFATGIGYDHVVAGGERNREEKVQEAVNQFFTLPIFALFGLMLPWQAWWQLGWLGVAFAVSVLLLRRLPFVLMARQFTPALRHRADALFLGWFGPVGAAALLYALLALHTTGDALVWNIGSLVVFTSLVLHGVTASPFTRWYGRRTKE